EFFMTSFPPIDRPGRAPCHYDLTKPCLPIPVVALKKVTKAGAEKDAALFSHAQQLEMRMA
ncbi:hypothetical protein Ciccas_013091, partial [Cichlidogyrus casuarinus]